MTLLEVSNRRCSASDRPSPFRASGLRRESLRTADAGIFLGIMNAGVLAHRKRRRTPDSFHMLVPLAQPPSPRLQTSRRSASAVAAYTLPPVTRSPLLRGDSRSFWASRARASQSTRRAPPHSPPFTLAQLRCEHLRLPSALISTPECTGFSTDEFLLTPTALTSTCCRCARSRPTRLSRSP